MKIKICESHVKVYEYLKRKVEDIATKKINIKYTSIVDAVGLSYPHVAKCMIELAEYGCIKKISDGKGRKEGGSEYLVDTRYKVFKKRVVRKRTYVTKYRVTLLELKKVLS